MPVFVYSQDFTFSCASPTRLNSPDIDTCPKLIYTCSILFAFYFADPTWAYTLTHCLVLQNFPSHSQPYCEGPGVISVHTAFSMKKMLANSVIVLKLILLQFCKQGVVIKEQWASNLLNAKQRKLGNLPRFTQQVTGRTQFHIQVFLTPESKRVAAML